MSRELIMRIVQGLPPGERNLPAVNVGGRVLTWNEVLTEVLANTPTGREAQRIIEEQRAAGLF